MEMARSQNRSFLKSPIKSQIPKVPAYLVPTSVKNVITYSSHIANIGWESNVQNGVQSGMTGLAYPMEAIKIDVKGIGDLGVR